MGMLGEKILSDSTLELFTTGKVNLMPDGSLKYAYGFGVQMVYDLISIGHNGGAPGINTDARFFSNGYSLIVFANRDPEIADNIVNEFARLLASLII